MPRGIPKAGFRMTKNQVAKVTSAVLPLKDSRFSINERFGFVSDMVTMLAQGHQASVVISGPGGLGKSHNVVAALVREGYTDVSLIDDFDVGTQLGGKKTFRSIKGFSTPKGLYRTLYENKDGIVVFDDCDSVLKNPDAVNLLKGALDSYSRRIISWRSDMRDEDLPCTFEFKGRVVFISNIASNAIDQAILTRSMVVDLSMTTAQKVERMRWLLSQSDFMPEYAMACKRDAMDLIAENQNSVKELSLRTLIQVTNIRTHAAGNWRNLAEYAICG